MMFPSTRLQLLKARQLPLFLKYRDMKQLSKAYASTAKYWGKQNDLEFDPVQLAEEVQDRLVESSIDCVLGGSIGLFTLSMPRMTKDVDFNVDLKIKDLDRLGYALDTSTSTLKRSLSYWKPKNVKPPYQDERLATINFTYKNIGMDIFLNTCAATAWVHSTALTVANRRIIAPHCLAYFKLFALNQHNGRYQKDMADLETLVQCSNLDHKAVTERIVRVFGKKSFQARAWKFLQRNKKD